MMSKGVLVDITRCIGCRSCQVACKSWNDLPADKSEFSNSWDNPEKLSANTWTKVNYYLIENDDKLKWRFVKTVYALSGTCLRVSMFYSFLC